MTGIQEITIFYSKFSPASNDCLSFVNQLLSQSKIPPQIAGAISSVCLDSKEARTLVTKGTNIQIKAVPSMILLFGDGNVQMFVGAPKIASWFQSFGTNTNRKSPIQEEEDEDEEEEPPKPKKTLKNKKKKGKKKNHEEVDESSFTTLVMHDEPEPRSTSTTQGVSGLSTNQFRGGKSSTDIMNMAKRMEAEREQSVKQ